MGDEEEDEDEDKDEDEDEDEKKNPLLMETVKRANSKIQEHNNKLDKANLSSELSIKDDLKRKLQHLTDTPFKLTVKDIHKFYTHEGLCYDKDKNCSKEDIDDIEDILDE